MIYNYQCTCNNAIEEIMETISLKEIETLGWTHGFAFGKHTTQMIIEDAVKNVLDNSQDGIELYMQAFNEGFSRGLLETSRLKHDELEKIDNELD